MEREGVWPDEEEAFLPALIGRTTYAELWGAPPAASHAAAEPMSAAQWIEDPGFDRREPLPEPAVEGQSRRPADDAPPSPPDRAAILASFMPEFDVGRATPSRRVAPPRPATPTPPRTPRAEALLVPPDLPQAVRLRVERRAVARRIDRAVHRALGSLDGFGTRDPS